MLTTIRRLAFVAAGVAAALVAANAPAEAHQWSNWHWNRFGSTVTIQIRNVATTASAANAAINDWDRNTLLSLPRVNVHTDISVYDGNYGATGWGGLASLENVSGSHILHAHAQVNLYYNPSASRAQGIWCQEIGHDFGLDHSNDGCMGLGYFNNLITTVQHNWTDISNMYRVSHHGAQATEAPAAGTGARMRAVWQYQPTSLAEAVRMGTAVVRVRVLAVQKAPDIVTPARSEPSGVDRIVNQRIVLRTTETLAGSAPPVFSLFHMPGIAESPDYATGQEYVLILRDRRADGRSVVLSPEGRFTVAGGAVFATSPRLVNTFAGTDYDAFRSAVQSVR